MPIYEYKCRKCGTVYEVKQRFSEDPLKTHEECGGEVERLISAPALQFKGSGWYVTDYARNSTAAPAKNGSNGSKSETKTDSGSSSSSTSSGSSSTSSTDKK